ncbi:hypothetical protein AMS68_005954 [Peltaster fructicola]|uniref:U3 small nucleolar RNA-associated protein 6 N-terminal domain-containing protein n=1 Tax=Peltaster fructicola TaxID=286661 RepID=A0A6H0Y0A7_9PEZI|nr:hypothetical protein AMS68_005954 [Peltaster fructicola]
MAAADKARFYLERTVPDLQELARKEVFSASEITAIVKKRSDFEHTLNGSGSKPHDYVRYAAYEMNLDALRKKRCQRLGVKSTAYSGQRTVFFILDRATQKFPADKALWMQYIRFCQSEKANKKLARVFTSVLRLRPRDWGLWVLAAKHYAEAQGDMPTARGYLQRGIRFCTDERQLYVQYAKLEMVYLAKLAARRRILGLDAARVEQEEEDDENTIALPTITAEDYASEDTQGLEHVNQDMLDKLAEAPMLQGAVPITIFDSSMKQFHNEPALAETFYDVCNDFDDVEAIQRVQQHVLQHLDSVAPDSAEQVICKAKQALHGVDPRSVEFPAALGKSLAIVRHAESNMPPTRAQLLAEKVILTLLPYLQQQDDLDDAVNQVIQATVKSNVKRLAGGSLKPLFKRLQTAGREDDIKTLQTLQWR